MILRFGNYELDQEKGELRCTGEPVRVQPKPFELLALLIRERERIVSLDELQRALWPDTIVTPASLNRAVSHARRAIGDTGRGELIRSHARRGYRFCAEVEELAAEHAPQPSTPAARTDEVAFVGREAALDQLMNAWREAQAGSGGIALIRGAPGIGKSRLAAEFVQRVRARDGFVVIGRGRQGEGVPPLWIWTQVLSALAAEEDLHEALLPVFGAGREYARFVPDLSDRIEEAMATVDHPESATGASEERRFLFYEACARSMAACTRRKPVLILLEDVHWSKAYSLGLFEHLAHQAPECRVLIVATLRDEPDPHPTTVRTLSSVLRVERCQEIALPGFSRAEVATLLDGVLGGHAPSELSSEVFARTEGVPLFVREAIRLLRARGDLHDAEAIARQGIALPMHSVDLIARTLEALPAEVSSLVGAGAVLGRDFSVPLLAGIIGGDREAVLDGIDRAVSGGVLAESEEQPGRFRFAHALFRDAAYERLSARERTRLHREVAERLGPQLEHDPDGVLPELAHHLHQSLAIGEPERAREVAERAAAQARSLAADEQAALHLRQALDAHEHCEPPDARRKLRLLNELAEVYGFAGDRARRRETAQRAMDLARTVDAPLEFARAAVAFCELSEWSPEDPDAERALHAALEMLGDTPGVERARAMVRLGYLDARSKRPEVEEHGRASLAAARETGDGDTIQEALFTLMYILAGPDRLDERAALASELETLAPRSGDRDPALVALIDSACDALTEGNAEAAAARRKRAAAICGGRPHRALAWHLAVYDAGVGLMEGRIDEGLAHSDAAVEIGRRISHPFANACWVGFAAEGHRWRGRADESLRLLERGIESTTGPSRWLAGISGRSHLALGNRARAAELLGGLSTQPFASLPRDIRWMNSMLETAQLCIALADTERARELLPVLAPYADLHGVFCVPVNYGGPLAGALAGLEHLLGNQGVALEHARNAVASTVALGARPVEMRQRRALAVLLDDQGGDANREEAAHQRAQADRIAQELELIDALDPEGRGGLP